MAVPEQFSLRWNDFHSNLSQSFQALLEGQDLVDVTLAAGGQYLHAHKIILSICSPYFKELFKMNPCEHPIVILKDVTYQELRQLLQFMYRGEVNVRPHELARFLLTAELLQIKGLTTGRDRSESPQLTNEESQEGRVPVPTVTPNETHPDWAMGGDETIASEGAIELPPDHPPLPCIKEDSTRSPLKRLLKNTPVKNNFNIKKQRPVNDIPSHDVPPTDIPPHAESEYTSDSEPVVDYDTDMYHTVLVLPESTKEAGWNCKSRGVKCPSCHRFFANRYNLKVHIRDKHDTREGTLMCDICNKRMRNPSCLRVHMYHHRKQAAYLSQFATQNDPYRNVVQDMVTMVGKPNKPSWRPQATPPNANNSDAENTHMPMQTMETLVPTDAASPKLKEENTENTEKIAEKTDLKTDHDETM